MNSHDHSGHTTHSAQQRHAAADPHATAGAHLPPARRYTGLTLDTHAHWYPQEWLDLVRKEGPAQGARIENIDPHGQPGGQPGYRFVNDKIVNAFTEEFVSLELRLAGMARTGVDAQALSLTTPMVYWATPAFGVALSQCYNDLASRAHLAHPKQFVGLAQIPMQDPALALKELERAAKLPGLRGLYLATNIDGKELDDQSYWDIYAKCEELGWPIFLHPVYTMGGERFKRFYLKNLLGNPYDTGVAATCLIFGGVLDRFPTLEINLPHAGGTLPIVIGRLDHGTKQRAELKYMPQLPSAYLRRFTYDTIGHDDTINHNLVKLVGADRVLLGSDYCFDMGLDDPVATVERLVDVSVADRDLILGKTAAKLLRME